VREIDIRARAHAVPESESPVDLDGMMLDVTDRRQ
jgi:hypothetical protein